MFCCILIGKVSCRDYSYVLIHVVSLMLCVSVDALYVCFDAKCIFWTTVFFFMRDIWCVLSVLMYYGVLCRDKGVKVELGIPYELWDQPPAEITNMQRSVGKQFLIFFHFFFFSFSPMLDRSCQAYFCTVVLWQFTFLLTVSCWFFCWLVCLFVCLLWYMMWVCIWTWVFFYPMQSHWTHGWVHKATVIAKKT